MNCSKLSVSVKGLQVDSAGHHHEWKLCKSWWWSQHLLCGVCFCVLIASSHNFCRVSSWYSPTRCKSVTRTRPYFFAFCLQAQCNLFIIIISSSFLKDFQPHPDIDAGAHHGQFDLPSDQEMWPELHVSAAEHRQRTHCNPLPLCKNKTNPVSVWPLPFSTTFTLHLQHRVNNYNGK